MQMYNIIVSFEPREFILIIFRPERLRDGWKGHGMDGACIIIRAY